VFDAIDKENLERLVLKMKWPDAATTTQDDLDKLIHNLGIDRVNKV